MKIGFKTSNYDKYYKDFVPLMKKDKNQKYFLIILSLSASIFFFIFAINPTLTTIANLKKQITDATYVNEQLELKVRNISNLSQEYQEIKPDLPVIMDALPEKPLAPTLVGQIQSLGNESSVQIFNIEIAPVNLNTITSTQSSSFAYNISGNGTYENMQKFIDDLIKMQRVLSVTSLQASKSKDENNLDFIIKGSAFYKK